MTKENSSKHKFNGINGFSVSNCLRKIVTNVDLYKFVVEANGLTILIQEFGENHDSGVGVDFVWRVC